MGEALGIDLAAGQIEYARRVYARPHREFRAADVRSLPVEDRFDAVVSIEVIEDLPPEEPSPSYGPSIGCSSPARSS